ncbi:MAG TPA: metabolite traffic protein EboE [Chthoniobacteraceae bacterium]|nr:metabolite traffic protein EboE [Chthoniobacteraceae bacterium]
MRISDKPPLHLTYCLNVHKGESWEENFVAIREHAMAVRDRVAEGKPFGLGLRLSARAAQELLAPGKLEEARDFFAANNLYAFTINGFPYGQFHAGRVKENVYKPDWRTAERRDYTLALAKILAVLLPEGMDGSISTVPCAFKGWIESDADVEQVVANLVDCAQALHEIREKTGKEIHLGLEPEPCCYLETTEETVRFFKESLFRLGAKKLPEEILRRHIGVCFDTCHVAIQFENLAESLARYAAEGIRISKIQVSAALRGHCDAAQLQELQEFCEPVYFHQVKARTASGEILSWNDLPEALDELPSHKEARELRVHFHVPLFVERYWALGSTGSLLTPEFFAAVRAGGTTHLEIETYTFDVLPEDLRAGGITHSIAAEFHWLLAKMKS